MKFKDEKSPFHSIKGMILTIIVLLPSGLAFPTMQPQPEQMKLTLEETINLALQANRSIATAVDNLTQSRLFLSQVKSEFELKLIPEATFSRILQDGSYGLGLSIAKKLPIGTQIALTPVIEKTGNQRASGVEFVLTQPLLRGLKPSFNMAGVRGSEYQLRTSQRDLYLTQTNVVLSTVIAVYDIVRNREILSLQKSSLERTRGYLEAALSKQKAGIATALDVYRAKIKLNQVESLVVSSQDAYQDSVDSLKVLLAVPLERDIEVTAPLQYDNLIFEESDVLVTALKERIEIAQLRDMIANFMLRADAARHSLLPDLNLVVKYSGLPSSSSQSPASSGKVEIGLSAGGDIRRSVERAEYEINKLSVKEAERLMSLRKDEIIREVKFSLRNLTRAIKNIDIQAEQAKQSRGKLELAKIKFSHGYADNFDIMEAETELRQAEVDLVSSVIGYITGTFQFKAAVGTLIGKEGIPSL